MRQWRRHVYLLVNNFNRATYLLRRIDASSLFVPSSQPQITAAMNSGCMAMEEALLPNPFLSFTPPRNNHGSGTLDFFALFGRGNNKSIIAGADQDGFTFLYDLDQRAIHKQVRLNEPKMCNTISVAAGDALYVMDNWLHPSGFEVLRQHERGGKGYSPVSPDWRWYGLPPPPYVLESGYTPTHIGAYTVVNDSEIWISTPGFGTFSFEIARSEWRKVGDRELPFRGRADYSPEYGLWLGFSSRDNMLCSSDLAAGASMRRGPELLHRAWEDLREPEGWISMKSFLVQLGHGRFCVAKFFQTDEKKCSEEGYLYSQIDNFAVLTGLMLRRSEVNGELRMIKHRSQLYRFHAMTSGWVF